ncbi:MAG: hypothetical protein PHT38_05495 [Halothiobacillus sp.]|nr:hypothetical protein [Halothiobacillus sp.]
MLTVIFENLRVFPEWCQNLLLGAWGVFLLIVPIFTVIEISQRPKVLLFFRAIPGAARQFGAVLQHQIDDPIKFPKVQRVLEFAMVGVSYLVAGLLFFLFLAIVIAWASTTKHLSVFDQVGTLGFSLLCSYWAAVLKTQGSRGLLKLRGN